MKTWLTSGLCLVLGLAAARSLAEEIQWRKAGPQIQEQVAAPPSAVRPIGGGFGLKQPEPVQGGSDGSEGLPFRRAIGLTTPTPVIRFKTDSEPKPLPPGPAAKGPELKPIPTPTTPAEPETVVPMPPDTEVIPTHPRVYSSYSSGGMGCNSCIMGDSSWVTQDSGVCGGETLFGDCGDSCVSDCWSNCCTTACCPTRPRWWFSGEYLLWNISDQHIPPLVTSSNRTAAAGAAGPATAGALDQADTNVIFSEADLQNPWRSGMRFATGFWFPRFDNFGIDAGFFLLPKRSHTFVATSNGLPNFSRPFFDLNANKEAAQLVAYPNIVSGSVRVDYYTRLWGLDLNFRHKGWCGPRHHVDFLLGYRHIELDDVLAVSEDLTVVNGDRIQVFDRFGTHNSFNGAQLGVEAEWHFLRRFFAHGQFKFAMGNVRQVVNINGNTVFSNGVPFKVHTGGLLGQPSNIGIHARDHFAFVPELTLKVGFNLTEHWRAFVAYDFLYISSVVRAGEQIDRVIDRTQIPDATDATVSRAPGRRPIVPFNTQGFWAQGVSFGLECQY